MKVAKTHYNVRAMNKYKYSKIDLQQKTGWLVKGMIKENEKKK